MKKNITVAAVVYNEEKRIENLLRSCQWSDDIIIVDKSSTDGTVEIAENFNATVIKVPYSDAGDEVKLAVEAAKNEWLMTLTASDMIHPVLVDELLNLINRDDFDYDTISMPFAAYTLGICDKHSPWFIARKKWLFKKDIFSPCDQVHSETKNLASKKIYKMKTDKVNALYHFTHQDLDSFFERHIRYTKAEVEKYKNMRHALWRVMGEIFAAIAWMLFYKRIWMIGKNGIAIFLAFLSYFMMKYLYIWEHFHGKGSEKYKKIQADLLQKWEEKKK